MGYKSFEELPAWNAAIDPAVGTFALTATGEIDRYSGFRDPLERAAVPVSYNIAEGLERGTHEELLTFLCDARGSAGEVCPMPALARRLADGNGCTAVLTRRTVAPRAFPVSSARGSSRFALYPFP